MKEPAERDPIIAPKLVVEVTMTLQLLASLSSHYSIAWKHVNKLPQEAIPKPSNKHKIISLSLTEVEESKRDCNRMHNHIARIDTF